MKSTKVHLLVMLIVCWTNPLYSNQNTENKSQLKSNKLENSLIPKVNLLFNWPTDDMINGKNRVIGSENKHVLRANRSSIEWITKTISKGWLPEDYTPTHCQDTKQAYLRWKRHHVVKQLERREPEGRPECQLPRRTPRPGCGSPMPGAIVDCCKA